MKVAVLSEYISDENRVSITPEIAEKFIKFGCSVFVEQNAGGAASFSDDAYKKIGAKVDERDSVISGATIIFTVRPPDPCHLSAATENALLVGIMEPYGETERIAKYFDLGLQPIAMDLLPRTSRAQTMDVLSSQSNLTGYRAVLDAAANFHRIFPMMTTAAGSVPPARVFVMGVGVAGLQAIATAKRLGAKVSATDVRPEVKEQIISLNAQPIYFEDKSTAQRLLSEHIREQDIIITTAFSAGKRAPRLVTDSDLASMKPGSVVVDLACSYGGNVEGSSPGKILSKYGIKIIGLHNGASLLSKDASTFYARNMFQFFSHYWNKDSKSFILLDDDISNAIRLENPNDAKIRKKIHA